MAKVEKNQHIMKKKVSYMKLFIINWGCFRIPSTFFRTSGKILGSIQRKKFRHSEALAFQKGIKRAGFKNESGYVVAGSDPDACFFIPSESNDIFHKRYFL